MVSGTWREDWWAWIGDVSIGKPGSGEKTLDVYTHPHDYWSVRITRGRPSFTGPDPTEEVELLSTERARALGCLLLAASLATDYMEPVSFRKSNPFQPDEVELLREILRDALQRYRKEREERRASRRAVLLEKVKVGEQMAMLDSGAAAASLHQGHPPRPATDLIRQLAPLLEDWDGVSVGKKDVKRVLAAIKRLGTNRSLQEKEVARAEARLVRIVDEVRERLLPEWRRELVEIGETEAEPRV